MPSWHDKLPEEFQSLLEEVYRALHNDCRQLAMMGSRTLVDLYMNERIGDTGGFEQKLKELEKGGLISKLHVRFLNAALEAGHAATHRAHVARNDEVNNVIDIVENLLQNYALETAASSLEANTPTRPLRQKKPRAP